MTKAQDAERAIRSAAQALAEAIEEGRKSGLAVAWPSRSEGLPAIAISETGAARIAVTVQADTVDRKVVTRAADAAQKAADKVIDKASDKA